MFGPPGMAPAYEMGRAEQDANEVMLADHRRRRSHPDRPSRRALSRGLTPDRRRRSVRNNSRVSFVGLVLVLALFFSVAIFFKSVRHVRGEIPETETARLALRAEVQALEDILERKKALLGVAPSLPLENRNAGGGGGPGAGGSQEEEEKEEKEELERGNRNGDRRSGENRTQRPRLPEPAPPIARGSLAGEALFGPTPPLRPSLESQPGLIREPVPLIVGGTDGSGTRGVVALLQRLKVPMVVEDKHTMDIHGAPYMAEGGWPAVVGPVIEWARGAGYDPRAAPDSLRRRTLDAVGNLSVQMQQQSARKLLSSSKGGSARYVSWGFKAPVSMLLVPFFGEAWGKAKFLHVVRDGRDIAFSGNQTPVEKFYDVTFPTGSRERGFEEPSVRAEALWNRWNVGVYDWAAANRREEGGSGVDYLLLHAEDLIDPAAKFAAIKDVAEFVGSPLSDWELCCIATEGSRDMGSHTELITERGGITTRFGKWKGKVDRNPELSKLLHDEGERGLRLFGYEPGRSLRESGGGFQCAAERDPMCPGSSWGRWRLHQKRAQGNAEVPGHVSVDDSALCVGLKKDVDFEGFDVQVGNVGHHLDCCSVCRDVHDCSFFTFDYASGVCYLKSGKGAENPRPGLVSGMAQQ